VLESSLIGAFTPDKKNCHNIDYGKSRNTIYTNYTMNLIIIRINILFLKKG